MSKPNTSNTFASGQTSNCANYILRLLGFFILLISLTFFASCSSPEDRNISRLKKQLVADESSSGYEKRSDAARKLSKIGTPKAIEALIYGFKQPPVWVVSEEVVKIGRSAVPFLIKSLKDKNKDVRDTTAITLGKIGDRSAVPALIEALNNPLDINDKDIRSVDVRASVASALGKLGDPAAVEPLCQTLSEKPLDPRYNIGVAFSAGVALGQIGNSQAIPCLNNKLNNCSENRRYVYANALAQVGDKTGIDVLYSELKNGEKRKREAALALASLGEKDIIPVLYEIIMKTPPNLMDGRPVEALGNFGPDAVPTLIRLLQNPPNLNSQFQYNTTKSIIATLAGIGDKRAIPILIRKMKEVPYTRKYYYRSQPFKTIRSDSVGFFYEALSALEVIGQDAVPSLIESLKAYPSGDKRAKIIETIGKFRNKPENKMPVE